MPTEAQRKKFRERVKKALSDVGMTQKALELQLAITPGTMTRVFGGKKQLDAALLTAIGSALDVDPGALVSGTDWTSLLADVSERSEPAPAMEAEPAVAEASSVEAEPAAEETPPNTPEAAAEETPPVAPEAVVDEEPAVDSEPRSHGRKKRSFFDYPVRAAVAAAGGVALVGAALFTLLRRR